MLRGNQAVQVGLPDRHRRREQEPPHDDQADHRVEVLEHADQRKRRRARRRRGQQRRRAPRELSSDPRRRDTADDLRARNDRGDEAGDAVRLRVPVELQQIRLQRVERVDADPGRERRRQHHPLHSRHPPAVLDRRARDPSHVLGEPLVPSRGEADVLHDGIRKREHQHEDDRAQDERNAQARRLGDVAAGNGARQHRDTHDDLALAEDRLEAPLEARRCERVDEPRLDRP